MIHEMEIDGSAISKILEVDGRHFEVLSIESSGGADSNVIREVRFIDQTGTVVERIKNVPAGFWRTFDRPFHVIEFAPNGSTIELKFLVLGGRGGFRASRLLDYFPTFQNNLGPGPDGGGSPVAVPSPGPGLILGGDSGRKKLVIMADTANTDAVFLGGASGNSAIRLDPGDMWVEERDSHGQWTAGSPTPAQNVFIQSDS